MKTVDFVAIATIVYIQHVPYFDVVSDVKFSEIFNMTDPVGKSNIYFNEVDKISILKPEVSKVTNNLKDECQIYVESKNCYY